ncbi:type VI secretion system tip protein VgrG [Derxia lacustris]|uniref:type VI secretion system tip protein VgrG n=1 Tax=Derxia lacustris TaxID=764842 RepID=UPI000A173639|nr:type VI secretion system tip protein VgrG [Derxia lacustris]
MATSPETGADGVLRITIKCDGNPVSDTAELRSLRISHAINRIASATLVFLDGDMPNATFPISDSADFKPGAKVTVALGYGDAELPVFEGIVIRHGISIGPGNNGQLVVECRHQSVTLTVGRKNASYIDQKDSDIISTLLGATGLSTDVIATDVTHGELVQYYCTDWDFVVARAEANGLLLLPSPGKLKVTVPTVSGETVLDVNYGSDLYDFSAEMDVRSQLATVSATAWDPASLATVNATSDAGALNDQGDLTSATLAEVIGLSAYALQSPATLASDALEAWAKGTQMRAGLARIRGHMRFQGSATPQPGCLIGVTGVGKHFSGSVFVNAVVHEIDNGNWLTEVEFGLPPEPITARSDVVAPPASGWVPGIEGLHTALVTKLDGDPAAGQRIQISLPILGSEAQPVWARLAKFYASNGFGAFFLPEVGDEVIVGFVNNDPGQPVVLGSVYGGKHAPPYELAAENNTKAIVTRSKLKLEFDDDKKVVTVVTPAGNTVVVSDDGKSILLQDQTGNKVELGTSGILLDSPKDITLTATGNIKLSATGKVEIAATQDLKASGLNVTAEAQVALTVKGTATAELSASGQTTVKGALVMIN